MIKKLSFLIVFMFFITLTNSVIASTISSNTNIPTISNTYTEGLYRFDNSSNIEMVVMLNNDVPTKLIIFDDEFKTI